MIRVLISDLHLDPARPVILEAFERFCATVARGADELWILGDLFEVWIGDDADDAAASTVRATLRDLAAAGTACRLMQGNRDFLLGQGLAAACGAELVADPTPVEMAGERTLLAHGDALCTDDAAYQALRGRLRSHAVRAELLARPLPERRALGEDARRRSREANEHKPEHIMDVNAGAVDALLDETGAGILIHGHTHRPGEHRWHSGGRERRRLVLGAWDEDGCVYARADATGVQLAPWP